MAPGRASAVIIGAGIVGNSLAYHLARLGWNDIVLVDKGPMPNPGGSTGHASNFIFPIEYSKMMMELTRDSTGQYQELGVFVRSGGIEVARTQRRMQELRRRCTAAKAWDIPAELLTPPEVRKLVPYLDETVILGGAHFPTAGVVDSLRAGTLMRERAVELGALRVLAGAEVVAIDKSADGRVCGVCTTAGDIETPACATCCGVWCPRLARMAGARIPLTPIVHQLISVGPIELFAGTAGEIEYPIIRDMDASMYERQHGGDMKVGSYAHRPIIVGPDDIPAIGETALSPTELPFTRGDFDPQLARALELMPDLLGDERARVRHAINGLISMTPDGHPVLGETPEVPGLWSVAASWIKEGPGIGRAVAEWMSGHPVINAEHLALRDRCGLVDLAAFAILEVTGPGALAAVQSVAVAQMDVPVGRVVYTSLLDEAGGFRADLTIMRLGPRRFRVVTGGATGMADLKWIADHLPADGSATIADLTSSWTTLGLCGPRARDVLAAVTQGDVSHAGFPFATCRMAEVGGVNVLASRISYVGELGWELHAPIEQGARVWDALWYAGQPHGLIPVGFGVYGTTGRLEKCYRAFGAEPLVDPKGRTSYVTSAGAGLAVEYLGEQDPVTVAVAGATPLFDPHNSRVRC
jgi:glycine cleavage system aminomethyltransferase T